MDIEELKGLRSSLKANISNSASRLQGSIARKLSASVINGFYTEFETPLQVKIADNSYLSALGYGDVCVRLYDSALSRPRQFDVLLQNTLYVPDLGNKLFSISSVTKNGGSV